MSTEAISWVFRHSRSRGAARLVLLSIAYHANEYGLSSWPSLYTISKETGVSFRQINRAVAELVEISEIFVNHNASPNGTNVYVLPLFHSLVTRFGQDGVSYDTVRYVKKIESKAPRIAPRFTRKQRQLWSELNVGAGPKLQ